VEPEFQRALIVVLIVGTLIAGTGTLLLFLAFRRFGGEKAARPAHMALIAGLVVFVFACCLLLFLFAGR
jgi:hypothetical protein